MNKARDWDQLERWDRSYHLHSTQAAMEHVFTAVDSMDGNYFTCRNIRIGETLLACGDEGHEVSRWTESLRKLSAAGASFNMLSKQGMSPGPAATSASAAPVSTDGGWTI